MPSSSNSRSNSRSLATRRSAVLGVLLGVTLLVTGVQTYMGQGALRDQRLLARKALLDNAAIATHFYVGMFSQNINTLVRVFYTGAQQELQRSQFPELAFTPRFAEQCQCDPRVRVQNEFVYDYDSNELRFKTGSVSDALRTQIVDVLRNHQTAMAVQGYRMGLADLGVAGPGEVVGFLVRQDLPISKEEDSPRQYAFGFLTDRGFFADALITLDTLHKAVPSSDTTSLRHRFALRVSAGDHELVTEGPHSEYFYEKQTSPEFGGVTVRVSIDQSAVTSVAASKMLDTRLVVLIGLMLLASITIGSALILTKRQTELAAAREDFVSSVSHELRTPLAQIRMFAETLLLGRVRNEVERRRSVEIIDQEAKRLTALVENVLSLSRSERGTARLAPAATELAPSIREVVENFGQLPRSRSTEYRLELEDRLVATVDPGAFKQILLNLLDNAIKYGPSGQRVSVGLAMFEEHARLWVDDEGAGIPVRERERVFEPFYRGSNHATSDVSGSGIGLAVVRELAGLLGGRAWVDDAPGGGARLVVEFPEAYLRAEEATGSWAVA